VKDAVGIVIPTLGTRPSFLRESLESIRDAGGAQVHLVTPYPSDVAELQRSGLVDRVLTDPRNGLSAAIDFGMRSFGESCRFINWLGDDDSLTPGSIDITKSYLERNSDAVAVFGGCRYVNESGQQLWVNRSGSWAVPLLRCGPQLIPQPGALIRRDAYLEIGGLNHDYKWAFDLDLFIRLSKLGSLGYVDEILACFRWHEGSLSVGGRRGSVEEASRVRKAFLPRLIRPVSEVWEWPMRQAISFAGGRISTRDRKSFGIASEREAKG
jgi:hypothetical protein